MCSQDGGTHGLFDPSASVNPHLYNSNRVWINYCDGGSYAGDVAEPIVQRGVPIYFRGSHILEAVWDELLAMGLISKEVLVSGCSAGGLAVYLHVDHIAAKIKAAVPSARVRGVPGAGLFLDVPSFAGTYTYTPSYKYVAKMQNVSRHVNDKCAAAKSADDQWQCYMAPYTLPFISTPMFISNSLADSWQGSNIMGLGCNPSAKGSCDAAHIAYLNKFRASMLDVSQAYVTAPGWGAFMQVRACVQSRVAVVRAPNDAHRPPLTVSRPPHLLQECYVHVVEDSGSWSSVKVAGQTQAQTFGAWFAGDAGKPLAIDGAWGTNPTC